MTNKKTLTLDEAIDLGEYQPEYLEQFEEFKKLSRYSQFQLIRKAIKNRESQLRIHYAELVNQLDFRKKETLREGMANIQEKIHQLNDDEEKLLVEYSK